ncbi:MltA domain-containing protein [uncultured Pseudodesulfovibrio sp.]|uniref:MltA domain-containing protein n=1 Tax=uncultured Pseudodesulfovibrio sp. TaxID=2035858 RepID=UPI0029C80505|nr:MltA domain-containing protein [uncultured Pseudodesulfovibrio sp.]
MNKRNMYAGNFVRLLLLAVCLAMLSACLKNGSFFPSKVELPPVEEKEVQRAEASGSLDQPRVTDGLTLKTVHEPESLPVCDLFFPLSTHEGFENMPRIDLASQGLGSWTALEAPVQRSLEYALNMPQDKPALTRPGMSLTWAQVVQSLEEFLDLLPHLDKYPELLARRFVWFGMRNKPLMTGYYTPEIEASLTRQPGYEFPIYGVPSDLRYGRVRGRDRFYRIEQGRVRPYYERGDMDVRHVLAGRGLEIAWAKDPLDVFYMQVEGCGRLRLPDGTTRNVLYGAKNGHGFRSLGRILHSKGLLPKGRLSKGHVKEYFSKHPEKMFQLMAENRSYVFFRLEDAPPEGTIGKPLTPMVSLATDRELLPLGSLLAFEAEIPQTKNGRAVGKRKVAGIGLAQDTGTAIRGSRLDYYIGEGNLVEPIANNIMTEATVYLLISKEALING